MRVCTDINPHLVHYTMARTRLLLPTLSASSTGVAASASPTHLHKSAPRGAFTRNAYESIRNAILDCTLLPGLALSEQALSEGLGVSRAPVRDALRQLATEGLVQVMPQRGTYVARIDPTKVHDAVFVREAIECRAAELACQAEAKEKEQLRTLLKTQQKASQRGDYASHLQADEELHLRILQLAGHPHAWPALRLARTGMNRVRHLAISAVGSHRIAIDQHQLILDAIVQGDAARAREHMREHIRSPLSFLDVIAQNHPEYIEHSLAPENSQHQHHQPSQID
jgi:GntR family transcriptional regulator, rspAB operon transcriptional repressor